MRQPLVVLGDALLDRDLEGRIERLCPEAPVPVVDELVRRSRPGGAALAAARAAAAGRDVTLVAGFAEDEAGEELRALAQSFGIRVVPLRQAGVTPEKIRVRSDGRLLLRLDYGGAPDGVEPPTADALDAIATARAILVADYGRGVTGLPELRSALARRAVSVPLVWDPHPNGRDPVRGAALVTPNRAEAAGFAPNARDDASRALMLRRSWAAHAVAVTAGETGAVLVDGSDEAVFISAPPVVGGDPCGAGDRFCATVAGQLADGRPVTEAVPAGVRLAAAFVAAGGAGTFTLEPQPAGDADARPPAAEPVQSLVARVRARGGTVAATGGCFDLLHAGHVSTLEAARELGDCLVVCLNSDASVRRLKGPDRPLVPQEDRAAVVAALGCVDAVVVFDEDTPETVLASFQPEVWVKGGDYDAAELPELGLIESWGGRTVILPFLPGRSTTGLIGAAVANA